MRPIALPVQTNAEDWRASSSNVSAHQQTVDPPSAIASSAWQTSYDDPPQDIFGDDYERDVESDDDRDEALPSPHGMSLDLAIPDLVGQVAEPPDRPQITLSTAMDMISPDLVEKMQDLLRAEFREVILIKNRNHGN